MQRNIVISPTAASSSIEITEIDLGSALFASGLIRFLKLVFSNGFLRWFLRFFQVVKTMVFMVFTVFMVFNKLI